MPRDKGAAAPGNVVPPYSQSETHTKPTKTDRGKAMETITT